MIEPRLLLLSNGLTAVPTIDGISLELTNGGFAVFWEVEDITGLMAVFKYYCSLDGGVRKRTALLFVSTYGTLVRQLPCLSFVRVINDVLRFE
ncbi:hypothetical protein PanWU01x14_169950 [Parasponia andersonii]|uniref:Uncharacterized protein n=1 Tax=Parasponia andersonii TaxID=3476 RepID=A0A2P5CA84_PARAD|nr:hypothetical protein PanWU01x14_169950 [Parasponia andersonii]